MICPVMSTNVGKSYETSTAHYNNLIECQQSECAWWQHDRCVVVNVATSIDLTVGLMAREI